MWDDIGQALSVAGMGKKLGAFGPSRVSLPFAVTRTTSSRPKLTTRSGTGLRLVGCYADFSRCDAEVEAGFHGTAPPVFVG